MNRWWYGELITRGVKKPFGMNKLTDGKRACIVLLRRCAQAARLMVGVGDYQRYCMHMKTQHADMPVMSETEYFRYCQASRYPSKDGAIKRCPC